MHLRGVPDEVDVFQVFDDMNCQLNELKASQCKGTMLFDYLSQSSQARFIQKQILKNTTICSPNSLKYMMAITTLELEYGDIYIINLAEYLNGVPPTLKVLSFQGYSFKIEPSGTHLNSIEVLKVTCQSITSALGETISASFPKLIELDLSGFIQENLNITLQI